MDDRPQNNIKLLADRFPTIITELESASVDAATLPEPSAWLERCYGPEAKRMDLFRRWVASASKEPFKVLVTTGVGDLSHLKELLTHIPSSSSVVVLECDLAQLTMALIHSELQDTLGDPRLILLTPYSYRDGITNMGELLVGNRGCVLFPYQPLRLQAPSLYDNILGMVMRQLLSRANQVHTQIEHAESMFSNTVQNLSKIGVGADIRALNGCCKNLPLVLVAAGPSLDDQLGFLQSIQGRALIVTVNSAFRAVSNAGIVPDITVAVDPKEFTAMGYRGCPVGNTHLVCSFQVYPEVVALFEGRVFPISSLNPLASGLRKVLQLPEDPPMIGDGTVSSTVVNLAAWMGCNEIFLVGQDLAIRSDGQTHVTNSFYSDQKENFYDTNKCQWMQGNSGQPVPVETKLLAYLRIFENLVSHYGNIRFFNLAPHGARIHGVPYLSTEEAADRLRERPLMDFQALIANRAASGRYPDGVQESLREVIALHLQFLKLITPSLLKFAIRSELSPEIQDASPHALPKDHPISEAWHEVISPLQKDRFFALLLQEGRTPKEIRALVWEKCPWKPVTEPDTPVRLLLPHAWALIEGALFQMELITRSFDFPENLKLPPR